MREFDVVFCFDFRFHDDSRSWWSNGTWWACPTTVQQWPCQVCNISVLKGLGIGRPTVPKVNGIY